MVEIAAVPAGYIHHRTDSLEKFMILARRSMDRFYVVREPWAAGCDAAGPFKPSGALRAYRVAGVTVPEGCELGPWRSGFELLGPKRLPGDVSEWIAVDLAWLPPSVSEYTIADFERPVNESCCLLSVPRPNIIWQKNLEGQDELFSQELVSPHMVLKGRLKVEWNIHPSGSLLAATSADLEKFVVLDTV